MADDPAFGPWLRELRRARDLTQEALAERAGCAVSTLRALESGRRRPSRELAALLAARLGLPEAERALFVQAARGGQVQPHTPAAPQPAFLAEEPLPIPLTALIGREATVGAVCALLERPGARLVSLTGPGGVGKTRVALQTAAELRGRGRALFPDGVIFVPLASVAAPALVSSAIASALGLRPRGDSAAAELLREALRERRMLLVLDNFEHILAAAPHLVALLGAAPGLRLLVTSRAVLHIAGELVFAVPPLGLPAPGAEDASAAPATRLFLERALAAAPDWARSEADLAAVAAICRLLDGLPLAIELAAARSRLLPPAALLAHLSAGPFETLGGGWRDLPARQRTLRATLDWSYGLLTQTEQTLLAGLGLFAGGWTPNLARAALGPELATLDALAALLDHSLVQRVRTAADEQRFALPEVVRAYALEHLAASGSEAQIRAGWAGALLELAERAGRHLRGPEQRAALDQLDAEYTNLSALLVWALGGAARGQPEAPARAALGVRLVSTLAPFWWRRGHAGEGQGWVAAALAAAPGCDAAAQTRLLAQAGRFAWHLGEHALAVARSEEALVLSHSLGDTRSAALARLTLGTVCWHQGDSQAAEAHLVESIALAETGGEPWVRAEAHLVRALVAYNLGAHGRRAELLERSLHLSRAAGDSLGTAEALLWAGNIAVEQGALDRAEPCYREAQARFVALGDREGEARALHKLGDLAHDRGDLASARALFDACLSIRRATGDRVGLRDALIGLGDVELKQGQIDRAAACYSGALALVQIHGDRVDRAWALRGLARVARAQGETARAQRLFAESLRLAWAQANPWGIAVCLEGLAGALAALGESVSAAELFGAADGVRAANRLQPVTGALPDVERDRALTRAQLGDEAFAAALRRGQSRPIEQAIAEALRGSEA